MKAGKDKGNAAFIRSPSVFIREKGMGMVHAGKYEKTFGLNG
jgi:hypothetical protein